MGIVDVERLNSFLGSPRWSDAQRAEAERILEEVESSLGDCLNTKITPVPYTETAPILKSGQVLTTYPVSSVSRLNGEELDDSTLPSGWRIQEHRLYQESPPGGIFLISEPFTLGTAPNYDRHTQSVGSVRLSYMAGLGNVPALRKAILRKAGSYFSNRLDETVVVRGVDADDVSPRPAEEEWTPKEVGNLSRFYNHVVHK